MARAAARAASILDAPMLVGSAPSVTQIPKKRAKVRGISRTTSEVFIDAAAPGGPTIAVPFVTIDTTGDGRADAMVADTDLDGRADALAAHLVAVRGFATFEELLDPELLDDLEALGPYGLLDVPRKKLAQRRQWWSRGEESLSPDIGPAMAALGLT